MILIIKLIEKFWWTVLFFIGGAMISRLWIGYLFRSEYKDHSLKVKEVQDSYNALCYSMKFSKEIPCRVLPLGQFYWEEISLPLRLCIYTFLNKKDRNAIRTFLDCKDDFKNQVNYFTMDKEEAVAKYSLLMSKHNFCLNFINNIGNFGTNNGGFITNCPQQQEFFCHDVTKASFDFIKDRGLIA